MGGCTKFFWREIFWKNFFFAFYSRYQNVRTERLKWRVRKVDITSGRLTIMVYFCNNEWVFILTKVQLYCDFVFGNYEISNTFLLLHGAYILISGMKFGKFDRQFSSFLCFHMGIFWKYGQNSKIHFVWTLFQKMKCTVEPITNLEGQVSNPLNNGQNTSLLL